jgi:hypothetical protein
VNAAEVSTLIAELFVTIQLLSDYRIPASKPQVSFVPLTTMQKMVCKSDCAIKGFYLPAKGVFIDEKLNMRDDVYSRSVLLHELVHHLQHVSGKFEDLATPCLRWQAKEVEAYSIQRRYLRKMLEDRRSHGLGTQGITCPENLSISAESK